MTYNFKYKQTLKHKKMKTKLLKKCKRKIKLFERNGLYYVDIGSTTFSGMNKESSLDLYRSFMITTAKDLFGFKPKSKLR